MGTNNLQPKSSVSKTNISLVDNGHQKLTEIHSHIKDLQKAECHKSDLTEIFFTLSYFYENYLIKEEIFLKKTGYPNLDDHSNSHAIFIKEIEQLKDSINNDANTVLRKLDDFIVNWLSNHEASYNAELVNYIDKKGL